MAMCKDCIRYDVCNGWQMELYSLPVDKNRNADKCVFFKSADGFVEVKHAYWIKPFGSTKKSYLRICSDCHGRAYVIGLGCDYNYCPNCGSKMDKKETEQE